MTSPGPHRSSPTVWVSLVTFKRPELLDLMLAAVARQTRQPDQLIIVDNGSDSGVADRAQAIGATYVDSLENIGPAGGIAIGMERVLQQAQDDDWLLLLDDNDLPLWDDLIERLVSFGETTLAADPRTAGVGVRGAVYRPKVGIYRRLSDDELVGRVPVDVIHGGWFPLYRVGAIRQVGVFDRSLWFGFEEGEYGLRLRRAGFSLYADGERWLEARRAQGELGQRMRPRTPLETPAWRRYYSVRNAVVLARRYGPVWTPPLVAAAGILRGTRALIRARRPASDVMLPTRGAIDGLSGRLGRRVEPPQAAEPAETSVAREGGQPSVGEEPLVSVIVPVFDVVEWLGRCVDSILRQSHRHLQVILTDDGSTDGSAEVCDRYSDDPRVVVLHGSHQGLSAARNRALEIATGEYLTFVDSDDWVERDYVEGMLRLLVSTGSDIVATSLHKTTDEDAPSPPSDRPNRVLTTDEAMTELHGSLHTFLTVACAKLYRKQTWGTLRFPEGRLHEDEATTYLALARAGRVALSFDSRYHYWQRPTSIMGGGLSPRRWRDALSAYEERFAFLDTGGSSDIAEMAWSALVRKYLDYIAWLDQRSEPLSAAQVRLRSLLHRPVRRASARVLKAAAHVFVRTPHLASRVQRLVRRVRGA